MDRYSHRNDEKPIAQAMNSNKNGLFQRKKLDPKTIKTKKMTKSLSSA